MSDPHFTVTTTPICVDKLILPKKKAFLTKQSKGLPKLHTLAICAAKRGGGKTTAVTNMIQGYKKEGLCDRCFIVSPTAESNAEFYEHLVNPEDIYEPRNSSILRILDEIESESVEVHKYELELKLYKVWTKFLRSNKPIESLPEELLLDLEKHGIMELDESPKPKYPNVRPVIHVLFDDIQGTEIMRPNSPLINLCIRHRHVGGGLGCSVWLLVQRYVSCLPG